jgi:AraC-like DNA-binding protein
MKIYLEIIDKNLIVIAMIIITAFLGLAGLRQIDIYDKIADTRIDGLKADGPTTKSQAHSETHQATDVSLACDNSYKHVAPMLSEEEKQKIVDLLGNIMQTKKLYLNPELKITDIASEVSLPRKQISRAVNEKLNDNFYNFVNRYRIGEAKRLLEDAKFNQFSIEGIARKSGFNSRSSFYTAFKNETGVTPSQFRGKVF